jgi:hypothetical protein
MHAGFLNGQLLLDEGSLIANFLTALDRYYGVCQASLTHYIRNDVVAFECTQLPDIWMIFEEERAEILQYRDRQRTNEALGALQLDLCHKHIHGYVTMYEITLCILGRGFG